MYIEFCKCGRYILTTGQMQENKPCECCQKEAKQHAENFPTRFEKLAQEAE